MYMSIGLYHLVFLAVIALINMDMVNSADNSSTTEIQSSSSDTVDSSTADKNSTVTEHSTTVTGGSTVTVNISDFNVTTTNKAPELSRTTAPPPVKPYTGYDLILTIDDRLLDRNYCIEHTVPIVRTIVVDCVCCFEDVYEILGFVPSFESVAELDITYSIVTVEGGRMHDVIPPYIFHKGMRVILQNMIYNDDVHQAPAMGLKQICRHELAIPLRQQADLNEEVDQLHLDDYFSWRSDGSKRKTIIVGLVNHTLYTKQHIKHLNGTLSKIYESMNIDKMTNQSNAILVQDRLIFVVATVSADKKGMDEWEKYNLPLISCSGEHCSPEMYSILQQKHWLTEMPVIGPGRRDLIPPYSKPTPYNPAEVEVHKKMSMLENKALIACSLFFGIFFLIMTIQCVLIHYARRRGQMTMIESYYGTPQFETRPPILMSHKEPRHYESGLRSQRMPLSPQGSSPPGQQTLTGQDQNAPGLGGERVGYGGPNAAAGGMAPGAFPMDLTTSGKDQKTASEERRPPTPGAHVRIKEPLTPHRRTPLYSGSAEGSVESTSADEYMGSADEDNEGAKPESARSVVDSIYLNRRNKELMR